MAPDIKAKLGLAPETAERLSALHHGDDFATLEDGQQKLDAYRALQLQLGPRPASELPALQRSTHAWASSRLWNGFFG